MLKDQFKRKIDYLRISITDRCDLRCTYCMSENMTFLPRSEILNIEELKSLIRIFNDMGVKKFRLTGGEPLVRKNVVDLIEYLGNLKKNHKINNFGITSNGNNLEKYTSILLNNHIGAVNISLDTLNSNKFKKITRWGSLDKVLQNIYFASKKGLKIKINTVVSNYTDENDLFEVIEWARKNKFDISLIEIMPVGNIGEERYLQFKKMQEYEEKIIKNLALVPSKHKTNGPSRYFDRPNSDQKIGFISSISHNFCEQCNRVRLTCTGKLYMCLGQNDFVDLKYALRHQTEKDVKNMIEYAMSIKPKSHNFEIQSKNYSGYINRFMNQTGG